MTVDEAVVRTRHRANDMATFFKRFVTITLGASLVLFLGAVVALATANPLVGTWHLNVAKSKFRISPPPKSAIAKVMLRDEGIAVTLSIVNGDGTNSELHYTAKYDGKDYALFNAVALKRIDDHTDEVIYRQKGKVIRTSKRVVSSDGKTLTITDEAPDGKSASVVSVWDRQ